MNKFITFAIVAFAACQLVVAAPALDEEEDDGFAQAASANSDDETGLLMGSERLFTDFCKEQRDYIYGDLRQTARGTSAQLFRTFFGQFNEITDEVLNVEKDAVAKLAQQINSPETPVSDGPLPEEEVEALIEQGKREIASQTDASYGLVPAGKAAVSAIYSAVNSAIFIRLAQARSLLTGQNLLAAIDSNCAKVAEYEKTLEQNLETAKQQIQEQTQDSETQAFIKAVTINSLHCRTTKGIARLSGFCSLFISGRGAFMRMLGINLRK